MVPAANLRAKEVPAAEVPSVQPPQGQQPELLVAQPETTSPQLRPNDRVQVMGLTSDVGYNSREAVVADASSAEYVVIDFGGEKAVVPRANLKLLSDPTHPLSQPSKISVGDTIRVKELASHSEYNGKVGRVISEDRRGRMHVEIDGEEFVLGTEHLEHVEQPAEKLKPTAADVSSDSKQAALVPAAELTAETPPEEHTVPAEPVQLSSPVAEAKPESATPVETLAPATSEEVEKQKTEEVAPASSDTAAVMNARNDENEIGAEKTEAVVVAPVSPKEEETPKDVALEAQPQVAKVEPESVSAVKAVEATAPAKAEGIIDSLRTRGVAWVNNDLGSLFHPTRNQAVAVPEPQQAKPEGPSAELSLVNQVKDMFLKQPKAATASPTNNDGEKQQSEPVASTDTIATTTTPSIPVYPVGSNLLISGLKNSPELNGKIVQVEAVDENGNYRISIDNAQFAIKPENVVLAASAATDPVPQETNDGVKAVEPEVQQQPLEATTLSSKKSEESVATTPLEQEQPAPLVAAVPNTNTEAITNAKTEEPSPAATTPFGVGTIVLIKGLKNFPEYNNKVAQVIGVEEGDRFRVSLGTSQFAVKSENVQLLEAADAARVKVESLKQAAELRSQLADLKVRLASAPEIANLEHQVEALQKQIAEVVGTADKPSGAPTVLTQAAPPPVWLPSEKELEDLTQDEIRDQIRSIFAAKAAGKLVPKFNTATAPQKSASGPVSNERHFAQGVRVTLEKLKAREFNGVTGHVVDPLVRQGRILVLLDSSQQFVHVKPGNLMPSLTEAHGARKEWKMPQGVVIGDKQQELD
eukprot:c39019_g1_i1.p1 GENE.c39019_g1_i1~~c39019_g1_i1.p1  ORF type:complete len:923 (+),score=218.34 c39019_g1_i1:333-2771(+)